MAVYVVEEAAKAMVCLPFLSDTPSFPASPLPIPLSMAAYVEEEAVEAHRYARQAISREWLPLLKHLCTHHGQAAAVG